MDQRRKDALKGYRDVRVPFHMSGLTQCAHTRVENAATRKQQPESEELSVLIRVYTILRLISTLVRFSLKDLEKDFEKTEDDIKAIQSVGQIIAEVLKQLDDERCENAFASSVWHY